MDYYNCGVEYKHVGQGTRDDIRVQRGLVSIDGGV
jgi:hypothetical protein